MELTTFIFICLAFYIFNEPISDWLVALIKRSRE